jgi:hypothetical protein
VCGVCTSGVRRAARASLHLEVAVRSRVETLGVSNAKSVATDVLVANVRVM